MMRGLRWTQSPQDDCLLGHLVPWKGTPYRDRSTVAVRGAQATCWTFPVALFSALEGRDVEPVPEVPAQAILHDPRAIWEACRHFLRTFPECRRRECNTIMSGDVLVTDRYHVLVAGPQPNTVWHCDRNTGVCLASVMDFRPYRAIFRFKTRSNWC